MTRIWNIVNDQSNTNHDLGNEIMYNKEVLKSNLCDYNDDCILVRGNITGIGHPVRQVVHQNYAPFTACIKNMYHILLDAAEDLG